MFSLAQHKDWKKGNYWCQQDCSQDFRNTEGHELGLAGKHVFVTADGRWT